MVAYLFSRSCSMDSTSFSSYFWDNFVSIFTFVKVFVGITILYRLLNSLSTWDYKKYIYIRRELKTWSLQVSVSLLTFSFPAIDINLYVFSIFTNNTMFRKKVSIFISFFDKINKIDLHTRELPTKTSFLIFTFIFIIDTSKVRKRFIKSFLFITYSSFL